MNTAREDILNKLKQAVHPEPEKPDFETPVYFPIEENLDSVFKENLEKVNGSVYFHSSEKELFSVLNDLISDCPAELIICNEKELGTKLKHFKVPFSSEKDLPEGIKVGITTCEFLIAHTGSLIVTSAAEGGRQLPVYPEKHVVVAQSTQIVDYLDSAYKGIQKKYKNKLPSQITLITGPSRTADIEKTLVMGAHGPRELHVFVLLQNKR